MSDTTRPNTPGVLGSEGGSGRTDSDAFRLELAAFTVRITDYMKTRITPWKDEEEMVEAVALAFALVFEDAIFETYTLAKRAKELFGRD